MRDCFKLGLVLGFILCEVLKQDTNQTDDEKPCQVLKQDARSNTIQTMKNHIKRNKHSSRFPRASIMVAAYTGFRFDQNLIRSRIYLQLLRYFVQFSISSDLSLTYNKKFCLSNSASFVVSTCLILLFIYMMKNQFVCPIQHLLCDLSFTFEKGGHSSPEIEPLIKPRKLHPFTGLWP